ncbi:MAG: EAL domain-containing protein [Eubacteriales bacterium]|nr:EAL domain-containing protein [Eubacteriales bacterium]
MKLLKEDFIDILEGQRIKPFFQPIVSLVDGRIIGYEALSRVVEPKKISNTEELFKLAGLYGKVWDLEQLCRNKILEKYCELFCRKDNRKLFINVNPMVIHDKKFQVGFTIQYLNKYELSMDNVVFEVTERSAVEDVRGFKETIRHYKKQGYKIAIDDVGSCYSGLNLICDIVPHYLKLDMELIRDIHKDTIKYAMVKSMVEFSNLTGICVIAEGIEKEEELKTLIKLGVHYGQGFFLRTPNEDFKEIYPKALDVIKRANSKKNADKYRDSGVGDCKVVLFKIENYKALRAYRREYGDEKGDEIINRIRTIVSENLSDDDTMAMINEDTVICILPEKDYKIKCETILNQFRKNIRDYYTPEDWQRGYIESTNKREERKKYPFIDICTERVV